MFVYRNFGAGSPFCERILSKSLNSKSSWSEAFVVPLIAKLHIGTKEQIYKHTKMNNPMWKSGAIIRNDILIYCNKPPNQSLRSFEGLLLFVGCLTFSAIPFYQAAVCSRIMGVICRCSGGKGTTAPRGHLFETKVWLSKPENPCWFSHDAHQEGMVWKKKLCRLNLCDMWIFLVLKKKFLKW